MYDAAYEASVVALRYAMGDNDFESAWAEGPRCPPRRRSPTPCAAAASGSGRRTAGRPRVEFDELDDRWRDLDKVVYSRTLETAPSARTRIERDFDVDAVRQLKASTEHDLSVSGPELAAHAIRAGLVDEYHLFVAPSVVGGGKLWLPDGVRLSLELLEERRFDNGMVYLRYRQGEQPA